MKLPLIGAVIVPQLALGVTLPAVPLIALELGVPVEAIQGTLVTYMIGYAISVLLAGLLSDRYGARAVQIWGLGIASAASLAGALAPSFAILSIARFIQALGGCVSTVTTRLIVGAEFEASRRMRILALLAAAIAVTPCIAPSLGGALLPHIGWRPLFALVGLMGFGILLYFSSATRHIAAQRRPLPRLSGILRIYGDNLRTPRFLMYAQSISLVWMAYFTFVSCSAGPLQVGLEIPPARYGVLVSLSVAGYVAGSFCARLLSARCHIDHIASFGSVVAAAGGLALLVCAWAAPSSAIAIIAPMTVILYAVGLTIPCAQAGLLATTTVQPGISSGLFFFIQMMCGALYAGLANMWVGEEPRLLALFVAVPAILAPLALLYFLQALRRHEGRAVSSTP
jgi:DHA1 family bicyclomycin/chloramphenicol resistance-like MFS transporter